MENFDRVGSSPFKSDGTTRDVDICFAGGSRLKVYGGSGCNHFRLRFGRDDGDGWWVSPETIDRLIAELLYIRRDIKEFNEKGEITLDIAWDVEEAVERDDEVEDPPL